MQTDLEVVIQRLWSDLAPTLRGDGFENENNTQFYNLGFEGAFYHQNRI